MHILYVFTAYMYSYTCAAVCLYTQSCNMCHPLPPVMFHQGAVPQEQAGKYKERKQMLDQVMAKDTEEILRTMEVRTCTIPLEYSLFKKTLLNV